MKTIILCGGQGTRMREETEFKPKPLVNVGGKPILWHIMKIYAHYGFNDFVLALGYKGDMIKQYFLNWRSLTNDFTMDTRNHELIYHNNNCDEFKITFVDTGQESLTGERVRRLKQYIDGDEFMVTYGDGVGNLNIQALVDFHREQGTLGTITGIKPASRFGLFKVHPETKKIEDYYQHKVNEFKEIRDENSPDFINAGFMVFKREVLDMIQKDSMIEGLFPMLAAKNNLSIYIHPGRWKCMDTHREVIEMNEHWEQDPFWKLWK